MQSLRSMSPKPGQRRNRVPLSCEQCRARKLKCNRQQPCQNCSTRNEHASCKFRGQTTNGPSASSGSGEGLRQRIDHLESLVKKLIEERQHSSSTTSGDVCTPESSEFEANAVVPGGTSEVQGVAGAGKTVMDGVHSVYVGGDDWHALLEEIQDLKVAWSQEENDSHMQPSVPPLSNIADGSSLLFQQIKPVEKMEILASLPPKPEVDRLIAYFFDDPSYPIRVPPILHKPTFMREYNAHWQDPGRTDFIWLGLLFAILNVTMLAYQQHGEPPAYEGISESLFQLYRVRTSQCLLSGDIAKCRPYTVETLRLNATAELNRTDDNRRGLWIMSAVVVRAAINMGYHRDPAHMKPSMPAQQAEYRRRVWSSVACMDDMASFLGGFPRMVPAARADTTEPRNLHDWELDALSKDDVLPPSRPLTEPTETTYMIVKGRLYRALGRVADFNSAPTLGSIDELAEVDRDLQEVYDSFPAHMTRLPTTPTTPGHREQSTTPAASDLTALGLLAMYHNGVCALHRKFLSRAHADPARLGFSRTRCLSSAVAVLDMQPLLPPLLYAQWQARQMMVPPAMVLLLELELRRRASGSEETREVPETGVLIEALERACGLWEKARGVSEEAGRVYQLLVGMLAGFHPMGGDARATPAMGGETVKGFLSSPRLEEPNWGFSLNRDFSGEFDWANWDAFMDGGEADRNGPFY